MASVSQFEIHSTSLGETRLVTVFLPSGYRSSVEYPVVYCADGQAVAGISQRMDDAITRENVPPAVLVGVHSHETYRPKEYIDGVDDQRFRAHETFFTHEIYRWSHKEFSLSSARQLCAVFGLSNGGAFALTMGARHREQYGVVIAFSIAGGPDRVAASEYARRPIARYYLSAGTREKPFHKTTIRLEQILSEHGVEHVRTEQCAGHDFSFWNAEFPKAIAWAFPQQGNGRIHDAAN